MNYKVKENDYIQYNKILYAKRILENISSNDFNDEHEYKLQKVRIYGETKDRKCYVIDSYGKVKFIRDKSQIFLSLEDMKNKINNIQNFNLQDYEKEYLLKQYNN